MIVLFGRRSLEQLVDLLLHSLVERGRRLVEEDPVGLVAAARARARAAAARRPRAAAPSGSVSSRRAPRDRPSPSTPQRLADLLVGERCLPAPGTTPPRAACPIGRYGRCGTNSIRAPGGSSIRPAPNGQMPAIARSSVVLPAPEGPTIAIALAGRDRRVRAFEQHAPVGQLEPQVARAAAPGPATPRSARRRAARSLRGGVDRVGEARRRSMLARQRAISW